MSLAVTLASGSTSRRTLLANAGIPAEAVRPGVDEEAAKAAFRAEGVAIADQALRLAELKAARVSMSRPGLVIGADQMLALGERAFDKPRDMDEACAHLEALSGETHTLETAVTVFEDGRQVWHHLARPRLTVRPLSAAFIAQYLDAAGEGILSTVGAYQLEGIGSQIFSRIEGDYFSILGLPLLPLLDYLRTRGVIPA